MRHVAGFLIALALVGIEPSHAQQSDDPPADSRLNAFACEILPTPLQVDVQILDNAERYVRYRDVFVARLQRAGVEVASNAPHILTLEVRKVVEFDRREGGEFFELRAGQENDHIGRDGDLYMRGNVWSNRSDSVLGGRKRDPGQLSTDQLQVNASINRRDDGRCLWQGEIRHDLKGEDVDEAARRALPILARALGKTVRNRAIRIAP